MIESTCTVDGDKEILVPDVLNLIAGLDLNRVDWLRLRQRWKRDTLDGDRSHEFVGILPQEHVARYQENRRSLKLLAVEFDNTRLDLIGYATPLSLCRSSMSMPNMLTRALDGIDRIRTVD